MQRVVSDYLDRNDLFERIKELCSTYRKRRDAMLEALDDCFPSCARWNHPRGGFFVWVELSEKFDTKALLDRALAQESIAFVPGQAFAVGGARAEHCMRLSFSSTPVDQIRDGIQRLASLL